MIQKEGGGLNYELALDTIKVRGPSPAHPRGGKQRMWLVWT